MDELQTLAGLAGAPIVAALVEVVVKPFLKKKEYWPLSAIVLGVALNVSIAPTVGTPLPASGVLGILTGLAASGSYSGAKTVREAVRGPRGGAGS